MARLWPFLLFEDGRQPPSWIFKMLRFHHWIGLPLKSYLTIPGIDDVIICSNFGFNICKGFISTVHRASKVALNFLFRIDFTSHRYNSDAAKRAAYDEWIGLHKT